MATKQLPGLSGALNTLQKIDPLLKKEAVKRLKGDVKPIVSAIKSKLPKTPLSNWVPPKQSSARRGRIEAGRSGAAGLPYWEYGKAKGGVRVGVRSKRERGMKGKALLISVRSTNGATEAFDMAGRKNSGNRLDRSLGIAGYGGPSRVMWPTAEKHKPQVEASIQRSVEDMEKQINRMLR